MADITKIVPTMITSNQTVSEVNGISLTKAKKSDTNSLPTTSFAQILEAQLSQENIQSEELQTDSKQILPGQNVDTSLFGSLIVVVRDVEVPISDDNDSQQPLENNRLFVPTIFTASTASNISIPPSKVGTVKTNVDVTASEIQKTLNTKPQSNEVVLNELNLPSQNISTADIHNQGIQPLAESKSTRSTNTIGSKNEDFEDITTPTPIPSTSVFEGNDTVPIVPQQVSTVTAPTTIEKNIEPISTEVSNPIQNSTPTRSLSNMLQSVQGLKMGFERSSSQQTFITVALPISEVERLVVANPEVFTIQQNVVNDDVPIDKQQVINTDTVSSVTPSVKNVSIESEELHSEPLFVPTSFGSTVTSKQNDVSHQTLSSKETGIPSTEKTTTLTASQSKSVPGVSTIVTTPIAITKTSDESNTVRQDSIKPVDNLISSKVETLAANIHSFATNLQTISTLATSKSVSKTESEIITSTKTSKQISFQSTVETISEKRTLVLEPMKEETIVSQRIAPKKSQSEPQYYIAQLLQDAESTGINIESVVVKIPVQQTKKTAVSESDPLPASSTLNEVSSQIRSKTEKTSFGVKNVQTTEKTIEELQLSPSSTPKPVIPLEKGVSSVLERIENIKQKNITTTETVYKSESKSFVENIVSTVQKTTETLFKNDTVPSQSTLGKSESKPSIETKLSSVSNTFKSEVDQDNTPKQSILGKPESKPSIETKLSSVSNDFKTVVDHDNTPSQSTLGTSESKPSIETKLSSVSNTFKSEVDKDITPSQSTLGKSESKPSIETKVSVNSDSITTVAPNDQSTVERTQKISVDKSENDVPETSALSTEQSEKNLSFVSNIQVPLSTTEQISKTTTETPKTITVEELPQAIIKEFVTEKTATGSKATFSLNPEQLGTVNVKIDVQGNSASITMESSQKDTIPLLEKQLEQLKEQLKTSNIIVEKLDIIFKPAEVTPSASPMSDTFTNSQQMEQQTLQQEIDRRQQNRQQQTSQTNDNENVEEIQPRRFGDGSSIIEEYI